MRRKAKGESGEKYVYRCGQGYRVDMRYYGKRISDVVHSVEDALRIRDRYVEELRLSGVDVPRLRRGTFCYWQEFKLDGRRRWDEDRMRAVEDEEARKVWEEFAGWA